MGTLTYNRKVLVVADFNEDVGLAKRGGDLDLNYNQALGNGTGNNQASTYYHNQNSVAASYDLFDLTNIVDINGNTVTFVLIREIIIKNNSTTSGQILTISGNFIDTLHDVVDTGFILDPSGVYLMTSPLDGFGVTNAVSDQIMIDPGVNTISYDLSLVGTT